MTEGTLARWLKKEGETIKAGDVIAEIETDKATMEVEAVDEGVLGRILVQDGTEGVKVNEPIAVLVDAGRGGSGGGGAGAEAARRANRRARRAPAAPLPRPPQRRPPRRAQPNGHARTGERIFASPLARRMAAQAGIDLSALKGSGPNGRIVRADIEAAQQGAPAAGARAGARADARAHRCRARASAAAAISAPHKLVPHSHDAQSDRAPADRGEADRSAFLHLDGHRDRRADRRCKPVEREISDAMSRDRLHHDQRSGDRAAGATLRRIPEVNASWTDDGMVFYDDVDISVAVADPGRADHADHSPRGSKRPADDQPRNARPRRTRADG